MRRLTYAEALNEALLEEFRRDDRCVLMGEDVQFKGGLFGVTLSMLEEFGANRILNMPISEAGFTGFGIGCATQGLPAVVEIQIFDFVALAIDQICNRAAKLHYMTGGQVNVPLVVRGPTASGIGLAAQHSQSLEGLFLHAPGLKVVTPSNPADAKGLLKAAIRDPNPVVFIESRRLYSSRGEVPDGETVIPLGVANVVREGTDITLIANSFSVRVAEAAATSLEQHKVSAEVIDLRTVKPLDTETIVASVAKTACAIVIVDGNEVGGLASHVSAVLADSDAFYLLDAPVRRIGVPDIPVPYAKELEEVVLPHPDRVVATALELLRRR